MIKYAKGDATNPQGDGMKFIVHCCNDVGGWGRGFVVAISKKWKEPEASYRHWHKMGANFMLGAIEPVKVAEDIFVVNLIGQHGMYNDKNGVPPIRYDAIRKGLRDLYHFVNKPNRSVHMPRMGAGLAGGKWEEIEKIINEELVARGIEVTVYDLE